MLDRCYRGGRIAVDLVTTRGVKLYVVHLPGFELRERRKVPISNRERATCSVLFLAVVAVFISAPTLRAQCNSVCGYQLQDRLVFCSSSGCSGALHTQVPITGGVLQFQCRMVGCCANQVPTWYFNNVYCACAAPSNTEDETATLAQPRTYVFVRGYDGRYRLTTFAAGS